MAQVLFVSLNLLIYLAIVVSGLMWTQFLMNRRLGNETRWDPRISFVLRKRPFWSPADFLMMFGIFILAGSGIGMLFVAKGWLPGPKQAEAIDAALPVVQQTMNVREILAQNAVGILSGLFAVFVSLTFLMLSRSDKKNALAELGFTINRTTIQQGLWGSLWLLPPVLLISLLASWLIEYNHPVLDMLKTIAAEPSAMVISALFASTVIIAPLVEEYAFRVLLQGSLQGMIDRPDSDTSLDMIPDHPWIAKSWIPIFVTSVLFALLHLGHGAAPIPLFFLSLGLGYLYRQTGSIVPPIIVHMVLNGMTTMVEFTHLLAE